MDPISYLAPYGYAVARSNAWTLSPQYCASSPMLAFTLEGHSEVDRHTFYDVKCVLSGAHETHSWKSKKRLSHLRESLYSPLVTGLAGDYKKLFSKAPFALPAGPPGTSARLAKWLDRLADCVNQGSVTPAFVVRVLWFFEAPTLPGHEKNRAAASHGYGSHTMEGPSPCTPFGDHHMLIHAIHMEEMTKRFEYEATDRCMRLHNEGSQGTDLLREVVLCLAENLEDHRVRLEARGYAWDRSDQCVVRLDAAKLEHQQAQLIDTLEPALDRALKAAAAASLEKCCPEASPLAHRRSLLESEFRDVHEQKTRATEDFDAAVQEWEVQSVADSQLSAADSQVSVGAPTEAPHDQPRLQRSKSSTIRRLLGRSKTLPMP